MCAESQPRKRLGAQPGNHNALKHGLYSRLYRRGELNNLLRQSQGGLEDEIGLLRILMCRVVELGNGVETLDQAIDVLRALGIASTRLVTLLVAQKELAEKPAGKDPVAALSQALGEVVKELGITD